MPVLPFLTDDPEGVRRLGLAAMSAGAQYLVPWWSVTLRDRQRAHFHAELDRHFPGVRERYEERYGASYECTSPAATTLGRWLATWCAQRGIATKVPVHAPAAKQLKLC
jgi:hypothetical protein